MFGRRSYRYEEFKGPTVGLQLELQVVQQHIANPKVGIIGICGMAGIGKSTFLRKIYQEFDNEDSGFDIVILSDATAFSYFQFYKCRIAEHIEQAPRLHWAVESHRETRTRLHDLLSGKRYLVMLDDVSYPLNIEELGIPHPTSNLGSKLLLSCRLHKICRAMNADRVVHVALLRQEEAWELFQMHAKNVVVSQPEIVPIARDIARACGGLPLLINTLGAASVDLRTEIEWRNRLELVLCSSADAMSAQGSDFSTIESSFDALNTDRLRACFLYCYALLEAPSVLIDDVIQYWAEQRMLGEIYDSNGGLLPEIMQEGQNLIQQLEKAGLLLRRSLLTSTASKVTMLDHVKQFALYKIRQQFLENNDYRQTHTGASMFPAFEIGFQSLDVDKLRDCFFYLSLFPAYTSTSINTEQLIRYWIGEGFLRDAVSFGSRPNELDSIFIELFDKGFPETDMDVERYVVIPNDFHRYIIFKSHNNGFLAEAGCGLSSSPTTEKWKHVERASFMRNHINSLQHVPVSVSAKLRALILRENVLLKDISHNIFLSKSLCILDLSRTGIVEIPPAIGGMAALAHLDLSFTKIKSLPKEVRRLVNLRFLGLEGTNLLEDVPDKVFSELSKLIDLNMYDSFGDWAVKENQISPESGTASLEELEGLEKLSVLGITISNAIAYEQFLSTKRLMKAMGRLVVKHCSHVQISIKFRYVKYLTICDCFDLKELVFGTDGLYKENEWRRIDLEVLRLVGLYKAHIVWSDVRLAGWYSSVSDLTIGFCHELTDISWVSYMNVVHLNIFSCKKLEQLIKDAKEANIFFNSEVTYFNELKTLRLRKLPNLTSICLDEPEFPALMAVKVLECPQLRKLPLENLVQRTIAQKQNIEVTITGKREWWDDLDWIDAEVKGVLDVHFQAE
ncbi:Disease resistance protein RPS2 [Apostasia shenzhenica]|uniref:Disease resistance protein RPS2 n=1 Tax=Apostasia shenzhenica TaxID=1088818 RepID=A0A2H9ZU31_9ASPA|nr:Disease resistance protein RPS2 [Apostasia shenzhenica]